MLFDGKSSKIESVITRLLLVVVNHRDALSWAEGVIQAEKIMCGWKCVPTYAFPESSLDGCELLEEELQVGADECESSVLLLS